MSVTAADVKALRDRTGAAMMDAKSALVEADGDVERAVELLRVKGQASAAKREGRGTNEGVVASYIHANDKVGAMVEVQCETDFVARNEEFRQVAKDLAVHILGANPKFVGREEVPANELAKQKEAFLAEAASKPENIREKLVEGKLSRWCGENGVLLDQPFVKDDSKTIRELLHELNARTGENITIGRYARFIIGEGKNPADEPSA
jgi:elongation factor Ts